MTFDEQHRFDHPAAEVLRLFTDRGYFERKWRELGFTDVEVLEHEADAAHFRIKVRYGTRNTVPLPEFARKLVPGVVTVTQTDSWDRKRMTGRIQTEIKGAPVKVACEMTLKDTAQGAVNQLRWSIGCGIPLLGGRIEKLAAEDVRAKSAADLAITRRILANSKA